MKIIKESQTQLVLREQPWIIWLFAGLCLMIGILVLLAGTLFSLIFIIISLLLLLLFGNISICSFDKSLKRMTLTRKWFKKEIEVIEHSLNAISDVEVEVKISTSNGNTTKLYRVSLVMMGGNRVPLTNSYTGGIGHPQTEEAIASKIRRFLNLR